MNKKKLSPTLKKLYKPFQAVFGFSLVVCFIQTLIQLMLENGIPINSLTETIGFVLLWICVIFGYIGYKCILPLWVSAALITISVAWAIMDKNAKNVFNLRLWITVALIFVSSVLQYNLLLQHF